VYKKFICKLWHYFWTPVYGKFESELSTTFANIIDKIGLAKDEEDDSEGDENEERRESDEDEESNDESDDPYKDKFELEKAEMMSADQDLIDFIDE